MATVETLLTADEYWLLPDNGEPSELVRGRIVPMNVPYPRHGEICANVVHLLKLFLDNSPLGHIVSNDSGVVTERGPDTVRGADVAYYSFARAPQGPLPRGYLTAVPELIFEVRSSGDRWVEILAKVTEYLKAGVCVVGVLDEQTHTLTLYRADEAPQELRADDEFTLPDLLPGFRIVVRRFFE
jgi:Uma2 family endonuclease